MVLIDFRKSITQYHRWWINFTNHYDPMYTKRFGLSSTWKEYCDELGYFKYKLDSYTGDYFLEFETEEDALAFIMRWN